MWAASFKSLYQKRPANIMLLRTVAWRGAPDTALRLLRSYHGEDLLLIATRKAEAYPSRVQRPTSELAVSRRGKSPL